MGKWRNEGWEVAGGPRPHRCLPSPSFCALRFRPGQPPTSRSRGNLWRGWNPWQRFCSGEPKTGKKSEHHPVLLNRSPVSHCNLPSGSSGHRIPDWFVLFSYAPSTQLCFRVLRVQLFSQVIFLLLEQELVRDSSARQRTPSGGTPLKTPGKGIRKAHWSFQISPETKLPSQVVQTRKVKKTHFFMSLCSVDFSEDWRLSDPIHCGEAGATHSRQTLFFLPNRSQVWIFVINRDRNRAFVSNSKGQCHAVLLLVFCVISTSLVYLMQIEHLQ